MQLLQEQPVAVAPPVEQTEEVIPPSLDHTLDQFTDCADLVHRSFPKANLDVVYFAFLVGNDEFLRDIAMPFSDVTESEAALRLTQSQYMPVNNSKDCIKGILNGKAAIFFQDVAFLVDISHPIGRSIAQSETETVITGPHDGFVENLVHNLSVVRRRIKSSHVKTVTLEVGEVSKTIVVLVYMEDIVDMSFVQMLRDRIQQIEVDSVFETNQLVQLIDDNPNSLFPQFMTTERPDAICSKIVAGRVACFVEGSPSAFSCPTSFFEFFSSPDDYYQRWQLGTALRILRIIGFLITMIFTALYVSVTTFHYEMIPHTMLLNLTESRSKVPFPPLVEAIMMETTIELLREAGARLPSKIGQTIGIVGGIVIGQAAVQAGFTSNILIIAVALSAIASFVIPSYLMSASIRLIRFGIIFLAGILGNFGIIVGVGLVVIHLSGITNMGTSYLTPIAPISTYDWLDTFARGPFWSLRKRPSQARTNNEVKSRPRK
ncbi:spore germination protein [Brevibacillus dissolubilis]|uniref:spore germination protein n=1 Tax=Brevibacillus dissolubilis TaxID=1844116 RepID=UPI00159BDC8D|nr:spore germination protein [Brevibacillus dissolubilis]